MLLQAFPIDGETSIRVTCVIDCDEDIEEARLSDILNLEFRKKILEIQQDISPQLYQKFSKTILNEIRINRTNCETLINCVSSLIQKNKINLASQVISILDNSEYRVADFPNDEEKKLDLAVAMAWHECGEDRIKTAQSDFVDYKKWAIENNRTRFTNLALLKIDEIIEKIDPDLLSLPIFEKWFSDWIKKIPKFRDFDSVQDYIEKLNQETLKVSLVGQILKAMTKDERRNLDILELTLLEVSEYPTEEIPEAIKQKLKEILYQAFPYSLGKIDKFFENPTSKSFILHIGDEIISHIGIIPNTENKEEILLNWFAINPQNKLRGLSAKSFLIYIINLLKNTKTLKANTHPWISESTQPLIQAGFFSKSFAGTNFGFEKNSFCYWELPKNSNQEFQTKPLTIEEEKKIKNKINKNNSSHLVEIKIPGKKTFFGIKMSKKDFRYQSDKIDETIFEILEQKYRENFILTNILYEKDCIYFLIEDDSSGI